MDIEQIFMYEDYRELLSDFLKFQKKKRDSYSARYFSKVAGFSSPNYCSQIVTGKRNITLNSLPKVIKALKFKGRAAQYFELLVSFNQSDSFEEKEKFYAKMNKVRKNRASVTIDESQFMFFSKWYYAVIREVACMVNWNDDYALLGSLLKPKVPKAEVEACVTYLLETGMITKNSDDSYSMKEQYVNDVDVPVFLKSKARNQVLELGLEACKKVSKNERYTTVSTYQLSKDAYGDVVNIIENSRREIGEIVRSDSGEKKVYELIHQLFAVTENLNNGDRT